MVFNSFAFLLFFLPVTLLGLSWFSRKYRQWAPLWLLAASLFFYGSWDYRFIPLLLVSVLANFLLCKQILAAPEGTRRWWLTGAVTGNLLFLGFFKYVNFFIVSINSVTAGSLSLFEIILPLGISFFTFTQISFLVDAYHRQFTKVNFLHYLLFASYFPYIVAGPILHHKDMLPQFADADHYRLKQENFTVGISLFIFGLGKKLLIADNLAPLMNPLFADGNPQLLQAWLGMLTYTLQLYFDFSGYSDMAIGVSRLLGFQIPLNFNSPYKATSVSDFWQRWHISLSRFLRNYLYIPLGGNRQGQYKRYRNLMLTMLLGGLWHGANWTFVVWGGLHGLYLCLQHGWQAVHKKNEQPTLLGNTLSRILTFVAVMVAWCFFRAPDVTSAFKVLAGMAGWNGVSPIIGIDVFGYTILLFATCIVFFMPNTNELFLCRKNGLEVKESSPMFPAGRWSPNIRWGIAMGCIFALCLLSIEKTSDFIYAQF